MVEGWLTLGPLAESGVISPVNSPTALSGWSVLAFPETCPWSFPPQSDGNEMSRNAGGRSAPSQTANVWGSNHSFLQLSEVGSWVVSATCVCTSIGAVGCDVVVPRQKASVLLRGA